MSTKPERERLIRRIKKLMALGQSPNPHEAAAALRKATELMREHEITTVDVDMADVHTRRSSYGTRAATPTAWLATLANVVCDAFGTRVIYEQITGAMLFIGVTPSPDLADYTYTFLRRRLANDRSAYYKSIRGKRANRIRKADDFALGWVLAVAREVERFAKPVPEVVGAYVERTWPALEKFEARDRGRDRDDRHLVAGIVAGSDIELQNAVPQREAPKERRLAGVQAQGDLFSAHH